MSYIFSALACSEEKNLLREDISAHVAQLQGMQSSKRMVFFFAFKRFSPQEISQKTLENYLE